MNLRPTYLFFDTETTGVPKNYRSPVTDTDNWPRMIQLGWQLYNSEGECFASYSELILPDGWTMPTEKFWTDNGYSHEKSLKFGVPIVKALRAFCNAMDQAQYLVAHNMAFDEKIVGAEFVRANMKYMGERPEKICTMNNDAVLNFCKLPGGKGKYKWPKLVELHTALFGTGFAGAHDAGNDVSATAKCFFELGKRNIIDLKLQINN